MLKECILVFIWLMLSLSHVAWLMSSLPPHFMGKTQMLSGIWSTFPAYIINTIYSNTRQEFFLIFHTKNEGEMLGITFNHTHNARPTQVLSWKLKAGRWPPYR